MTMTADIQKTIPGPRNTYPLGEATTYAKDQLGYLHSISSTHGRIARVPFGFVPGLYLISSATGAQHILQDNPSAYHKHPIVKTLFDVLTGGPNLFTVEDDIWLRQRRLLQPAFHRQRLEAFVTGMTRNTNDLVDRWTQLEPGSTVNLEAEMMRVTLAIVGQALLSQDLSASSNELGQAYTQLTQYVTYRLRVAFPMPLWVPTQINRSMLQARALVQHELHGIIGNRRASQGNSGASDLLSMLLESRYEDGASIDDAHLSAEISLFLFAGHETTANALVWAFYEISRHSEVEAKLLEEFERVLGGRSPTLEDLPKLEYTRMVFEETMRLYPPTMALARTSIKDDQVDGYDIPKGSSLAVFIYGLHHDPEYWPEPERFDPERFAVDATQTRDRFAYIPFSAGPRQCIGNTFAMLEAQVILVCILQRFRLRLFPNHPVEPVVKMALKPKHGMPIKLEPR
jgi:cytochrome P450